MPRFEPFTALRYAPGSDLARVTAPPYDVLSDDDLDRLGAVDEHNITHVDVPREKEGDQRYERAARTMREWIDAEVLVRDPEPTFTIHRMSFDDASGTRREIVGVLGGIAVEPYGDGGVLPHERITPKASTDRLDLTRATEANLSAVWGLSLASGLTDLLRDPATRVGELHADGVDHVVERVDDPDRIRAIADLVATDDVLIADGHHRYGVAQQYRQEMHDAGRTESPADETLMFVNELVADQLSVEAIHRLYTGIGLDDLRAALDRAFDRSPAPDPDTDTIAEMARRGALCLVAPDGSAEWLEPRSGDLADVRDLDGAYLEHVLDDVEHTVTYQHGLDRVVDAVTEGAASAGVLIRPVSVEEIERTAREGVVMPPKSTFFTPKLPTGFVIRPLS